MRNQTLFANALLTNQSINNGLINTTNTVAWTGGNGGNGSSATPIEEIEQGAVDTTIALYNTLINSVPRLPKPPPAPLPNSTLYPQGCNIIKYNNTGAIQWTVDVSGTTVFAQSMTTDGTNVYTAGEFLGTIIFINSDGTYFRTPTPITTDANGCFIVKYNSNGFTQWAAYITSQTFLQLLSNVTDAVNSYQAGNCLINVNVYNSDGTLYGEPLKQSVSLFEAKAITSDGTYLYIIDSNPIAYKFKSTGEVVDQLNLKPYGMGTDITSIVWLAGYLYIDDSRTTIWQLNTILSDTAPPVKFITDIDYPGLNGVFSITTNYVSALYMVNIRTPNIVVRAIVNNSVTPPSLTSVTFKGLNNISGLGDGIIFPFGVSYTNYGTLSNGHLLITDYNSDTYPDVSGIIWDVAGVDTAGNWAPSGNLFLTVNAYTGTGPTPVKYINVGKSVNMIYADPNSYNIYVSLYGTNTLVKYNYNKPSGILGPKIKTIGNGTALFNITGLNNIFYTLNRAAASTLYSVNYPQNRIISKQIYPLSANYNSGFVIKYNSSGTVSWISQFGSTNANCTVSAIAIGPTGIYITGSYGATGSFVFKNQDGNPSGVVLASISNITVSSAFVAKYTIAGNAVWAAPIGNLNSASGTAICVDSLDNVYVAGIYYGTRQSGPLTVYSAGGNPYGTTSLGGYNSGSAVYLAKYGKNAGLDGVVQFAVNIIAETSNTVNSIVANATNVYLVGSATGNITCSNNVGDPFGPINISGLDGVLICYTTYGAPLWVTNIYGGIPYYISLFDNLYLSGQITSPLSMLNVPYDVSGAVIPPPSGQPINSGIGLSIAGGYNDFLITYNTDGIAQWAQNTSSPYPTQTSTGGLTYGKNVEYVSVSIQPPVGIGLFTYGTNIIKYSSGGTIQWVADISGNNITFAGLGTDGINIYGTGLYNSNIVTGIPIFINSDKTITVVSNIVGDTEYGMFFVKYNSAGIAQWTNNVKKLSLEANAAMISDGTYTYALGYASGFSQGPTIYNLDGTVFYQYSYSYTNVLQNIYIIQYDSSGNPVWSSSIFPTNDYGGGYGFSLPTQIVWSSSGLYLTGTFGTIDSGGNVRLNFYDATHTLVPGVSLNTNAAFCMFVAKYNTSGTPVWATKVDYGDPYDGSNGYFGRLVGYSLAVDSTVPNSIYALGWYSNYNSTVGPFPVNVYSASNADISGATPEKQVYGLNEASKIALILVKYDSNGNVIWATNIRSPDGDPINRDISPSALTVSEGFIYIVGSANYADVATYDPANATTNPAEGTQTQTGATMIWNGGGATIGQGRSDGILIVYNINGIPQWKTHIIGTSPYNNGVGVFTASVITGGGIVYVSGYFDSLGPPPIVTFYNTPDGTEDSKFTLTNTANANNFTVAYSTEGKVLWVKNTNTPGTNGVSNNSPMAYTNALYVASYGDGVAI